MVENKGNFLKTHIKRDKSHYVTLEDDSKYEEWRIQTVSTIHAHQCEEIINNSPIPSDPDDLVVYQHKNTYLYDVLLSKVKTTMGKHYIRMFKDTRDAASAWRAYDGYMRSSSMAKIKSNNILKELTTLKFDPRGSTTSQEFIVKWLEKLDRFEDYTPLTSHFPDDMKKTLLENALSGTKTFKDIITQETINLAQGGKSIPYINYITIIKKLAADFDERASNFSGFKRHGSQNRYRTVNNAEYSPLNNNDDELQEFISEECLDDFNNLEINRGERGAFNNKVTYLDKEIWDSMEMREKDAWFNISNNIRRSILDMRSKGNISHDNKSCNYYNEGKWIENELE